MFMKITMDNYRQTVSCLIWIWHMGSYIQPAIFLSTINVNITRKLFQRTSFLKGCTYLQYLNTKQQTATVNSFSFCYVCGKKKVLKFLNLKGF